MVNGVLYRRLKHHKARQDHLQLVVPKSMRDATLEESHASNLGGHLGEDRTLSNVRRNFSGQVMQRRSDNGAELVLGVHQGRTHPRPRLAQLVITLRVMTWWRD